MGSHCEAELKNASDITISGDYQAEILNRSEQAISYSVAPGETLKIDMEFVGHGYYKFTINAKEKGANYFEIRSVSDFLLLQQVLIKRYNLELINARPDYRDFW